MRQAAKGPPPSNVAKQKETVSKKVIFYISLNKSFVGILNKRLSFRQSVTWVEENKSFIQSWYDRCNLSVVSSRRGWWWSLIFSIFSSDQWGTRQDKVTSLHKTLFNADSYLIRSPRPSSDMAAWEAANIISINHYHQSRPADTALSPWSWSWELFHCAVK